MPFPGDVPRFGLPPVPDHLEWEEGGPYFMVLNLTELEAQTLIRAVNRIDADSTRRRMQLALRNGLAVQHLDEFRGAAIEPVDQMEPE